MSGTFLVTGASKGLGRSIAIAIAESGNNVIGLARSSADLDHIGQKLRDISAHSMTIPCDLGSSEEISTTVDHIKSKYEHIDGIIHNAGTIKPIANMFEAKTSEWANLIRVNLVGVQDLTSSLSKIIGGEKHTRIVTISSGAAKRSLHGWSAYCVSKAGLDMWTKCVAEEGGDRNISALAIAPGIVDTDMQKTIRRADESDFPMLENFIDYYNKGELTDPDVVAEKLLPFCLGFTGQNGDRLDVRNL